MKKSQLETVVTIGVVLLVVNMALTGYAITEVDSVDSRLDSLESNQEVVENAFLHAGSGTESSSPEEGTDSSVRVCQGELLVIEEMAGSEGQGFVQHYTYQPLPGDGIYYDTSELTIERNFQESTRTVQTVIEESEYSPELSGMRIGVESQKNWEYIEGKSGGLSFAAELAAQDPRYSRNESVILTGVVFSSGDVGSVNAVRKKVETARDQGYDVVVAPHTYNEIEADGIRVVHVKTVDEALKHALNRDVVEDAQSEADTSQPSAAC